MQYGTSHFIDKMSAVLYYKQYDPALTMKEARQWVQHKLIDGEIHLGKPILKEGETCFLDKHSGRYWINDHKHPDK